MASPVQVFIAAQVLQFDGLDLVIVQVELMKTVREVWEERNIPHYIIGSSTMSLLLALP